VKRINFNTKWYEEIRAEVRAKMDKAYPRGTNEQVLFDAIVEHATIEKMFMEIANSLANTSGYETVDPEKASWFLEHTPTEDKPEEES
jgi:hypothetical protein